MRLLRRFGGVMVLLLSAVGILACASGIIGVWMLYRSVSDKVQTIVARLDVGLQRVSTANQNVRRAIEKARADVAVVSKESPDLGGGGEKARRARCVRLSSSRPPRTLTIWEGGWLPYRTRPPQSPACSRVFRRCRPGRGFAPSQTS